MRHQNRRGIKSLIMSSESKTERERNMEIEIIPNCERFYGYEYGIFPDLEEKHIIENGNIVRVIPEYMTKTRISTAIYVKKAGQMAGINYRIAGFKTHRQEDYNYFSSRIDVKHYFVKSKKQDYEVYQKYVEEAVRMAMATLGVEIDRLVVEIETWD